MSGFKPFAVGYSPVQEELHDVQMLPNSKSNPRSRTVKRRAMMAGGPSEIALALAFISVPLLLFVIVLLILVYNHRIGVGSDKSFLGTIGVDFGNAIFVDYSATRLILVASWASTVSFAVIPLAMALFSYVTAGEIARLSDENKTQHLPPPFQLALLIRILDGRFTAIWSWIRYAVSARDRRLAQVPDLVKAGSVLVFMVLLALLIAGADTWLHVSTKTVQLIQVSAIDAPEGFTPSRVLASACATDSNCAVHLSGSGEGWQTILLQPDEAFATLSNTSQNNKVYTVNGSTLLGHVHTSTEMDFEADSYASTTTCDMVTQACGAQFSYECDACQEVAYSCNKTDAGFDLVGAFTESSTNTNFTYITTNQSLPFQFQDSSLPWALAFTLPTLMGVNSSDNDGGIWTDRLGVISLRDAARGVMSCSTTVQRVTYRFSNGTIANATYGPLNATQMGAFAVPIVASTSGAQNGAGYGVAQLYSGLIAAASVASDPKDFAQRFATVYDQVNLALPAGLMTQDAPSWTATRRNSIVTRVPNAPFLALIVLSLLYVVIAFILATLAFSRWYTGARDAQVRFSTTALVAESFERTRQPRKTKTVDDWFSERRGVEPGRIALVRSDDGGRRYMVI